MPFAIHHGRDIVREFDEKRAQWHLLPVVLDVSIVLGIWSELIIKVVFG